jgi:hypothetical protein
MVRSLLLVLAAGLAVLPAGCEVVLLAARNAASEPALACDALTLACRARRLARDAYDQQLDRHPGCPPPPADFAHGYRDGYADLLLNGGPGEPPAVPPGCYRHHQFATPDGYHAVELYFDGFRRGAADAIAGGQRRLFLVPVLLPPEPPPPAPPPDDGGPDPALAPGSKVPGGAGGAAGGPGGLALPPVGSSPPPGLTTPAYGRPLVPPLPPARPPGS